MRIADENGNSLSSVYLAHTDQEARELIGDLTTLLSAERGWHAHVTDLENEHEVTVYRADDDTAVF
jgi:hypothetical protein